MTDRSTRNHTPKHSGSVGLLQTGPNGPPASMQSASGRHPSAPGAKQQTTVPSDIEAPLLPVVPPLVVPPLVVPPEVVPPDVVPPEVVPPDVVPPLVVPPLVVPEDGADEPELGADDGALLALEADDADDADDGALLPVGSPVCSPHRHNSYVGAGPN